MPERLSQLVQPLFPRVQPSDLITADFMNRILAALEGLDARIRALEADGAAVAITQIFPSNFVQINEKIYLKGRNFGFSTRTHHVSVDGVEVKSFDSESNDETLIFIIPEVPLPSPPAVLLVVRNRSSTAEAFLRISSSR